MKTENRSKHTLHDELKETRKNVKLNIRKKIDINHENVIVLQKNAAWLSVPQFGDWDQKGVIPDYSLDFSKIREMRKQNKRDPSRASIGNEEELISSASRSSNSVNNDHHNHSPTVITFSLFKIIPPLS